MLTQVLGGERTMSAKPVTSFFVIAYVWSWTWWWLAAAFGRSIDKPAGLLLYVLGVFGPLVGALWIVSRHSRTDRRAFIRRVWDVRGIAHRWWWAVIALAAGPAAIGAVGNALAGQAVFTRGMSVAMVVALAAPAFVAGLAEEPGWRGAVLDAWHRQTPPVVVALGIGALWSLWHLPLSFVQGTYYHELGFGSTRMALTHLMVALLGILLVWLVHQSGGRIVLAVLAHTLFNTAIGIVAGNTARDIAVFIGLAAGVAATITALVMPTDRHRAG